jgi:pilus assembly protein CpaC
MESSGFAYTLARPSLVALSGQSASFLAGGEFPVPVPNGEGNGISIEYKEYGVRLTLTPTVVGRNRIALKVAPEVSELDFTAGVTIAGTTVPALNVRRTDTSVSLADGESFVISGLINTSNIASVDKFPGLGDIPILGALFRSSQINRDERELLMIVTPHLVQPLAANAPLPALPGESLRNYDPNFLKMYFLENGNFDRRSGLSQ